MKNTAIYFGIGFILIIAFVGYEFKANAPNYSPKDQSKLTPKQVAAMNANQLAALDPKNLTGDALAAYNAAKSAAANQGIWAGIITDIGQIGGPLLKDIGQWTGSSPSSTPVIPVAGSTYSDSSGVTASVTSDGGTLWSDGTFWPAGTETALDPYGNLYVSDTTDDNYIAADDPFSGSYIPG